MEKLRVVEAFSGIGSQTQALKNLGIPHEVVAISEIDKFAIKSYEAMHGEVLNLGDISKVDVEDVPDHDLFTYSFPCQDVSALGGQYGFTKDSGTRSSLLWECQKVIEYKKPKYLLLENVKDLVSGKFIDGFNNWIEYLDSIGYKTHWDILNSKDYGVPQSRPRVFAVSILGEYNSFEFPKSIEMLTSPVELLDDNVDDKYFFNSDKSDIVLSQVLNNSNSEKFICDSTVKKPKIRDVANCITARYDAGIQKIQSVGTLVVEKVDDEYCIRKLTPRETWRFMGFKDEQFDKVENINSNTQLYKQAGNSIVVDVLEGIFKNMFADRID